MFVSMLLVLVGGTAVRSQVPQRRILVFSKTTGYRHDCIPSAIEAVRRLGEEHEFGVEATEDSSLFTDGSLAGFDAVVFLCTTGDVLSPEQRSALQTFIRGGHGFAGVHSASDTEHGWPWYGGLVGAYFQSHPAIAPAVISVVDRVHQSTRELPARWMRTDEWYDFASNPRESAHVLATLDESTYSGGTMGPDHPIAWCRFYDGGRSWYTALGHTTESYAEPLFLRHLLGGIQFAAGLPDCATPRNLAPRR